MGLFRPFRVSCPHLYSYLGIANKILYRFVCILMVYSNYKFSIDMDHELKILNQ